MRDVKLDVPVQTVGDLARLARLTRHLRARLLDFGPGGPEVLSVQEESGLIAVRFPGHDTADVLHALSGRCGVCVRLEGEQACFCLKDTTRFEDLDYVWGSLFEIL